MTTYRELFAIDGSTRLVAGMLLGRVAAQMVALTGMAGACVPDG